MKPMKLAEVRKHTGRKLTYAEAVNLANPGDPFLRNMAIALSLHSWNNTPQDWLRLEAALVILHQESRRTCRYVGGSVDGWEALHRRSQIGHH